MNNFLFIALSSCYLFISFTGLVSCKMKRQYYLLLIFYLIVVYAIIGPLIGQYVTFPLVFISIAIIYFGSHRNIWQVVFSLTGYMVGTLANHLCTVPLSFFDISASDIQTTYLLPFLITVTLLTWGLNLSIKKFFLHPKLKYLTECSQKLQYLILMQLLVCVVLFAVNFVYGEAVGYPSEVLSLNGLIITIFTLFTMVMFYCFFVLFEENYTLRLQQKEQEILVDYSKRMEGFYEEFRIFRHDYKNILSTLSYHIKEANVAELQSYFQNQIIPFSETLSDEKFVLGKLNQIKIPALKSIFYVKLLSILNKGVSLTLEITEPLATIPMNELELSRILGILIDNSVEAALRTEDKLLTIAIALTDNSVLFSIVNSCLPIEVPLATLTQSGYTSKEEHDGLGLHTVQTIVDSLDNVTYTMQYDGLFRQVLEITNL